MRHSTSYNREVGGGDMCTEREFTSLVKDRLGDYGVVLKAPKKRVFPVTPMRAPASSRRVFGRPLRDLAPNSVVLEGSEVIVPHFLYVSLLCRAGIRTRDL